MFVALRWVCGLFYCALAMIFGVSYACVRIGELYLKSCFFAPCVALVCVAMDVSAALF